MVLALCLVVLAVPTTRHGLLRRGGHGPGDTGSASGAGRPGGVLTVVGLGDSVEQGTHCPGCTNLLQLTADRLGVLQHRATAVVNVSANGYTTDDILTRLDDRATRRSIADSDLVVIEIGANDFDASLATAGACATDAVGQCWAAELRRVRSHLATIVQTVEHLQTRSQARTVVMGYWNVFADGQVGASNGANYVQASTQLTRAFNEQAREVARDAGVLWADAWTPFRGTSGTEDDTRYLAQDGDHPNQAGHRLLADAVIRSLGTAGASV